MKHAKSKFIRKVKRAQIQVTDLQIKALKVSRATNTWSKETWNQLSIAIVLRQVRV